MPLTESFKVFNSDLNYFALQWIKYIEFLARGTNLDQTRQYTSFHLFLLVLTLYLTVTSLFYSKFVWSPLIVYSSYSFHPGRLKSPYIAPVKRIFSPPYYQIHCFILKTAVKPSSIKLELDLALVRCSFDQR